MNSVRASMIAAATTAVALTPLCGHLVTVIGSGSTTRSVFSPRHVRLAVCLSKLT
jgi:hypothetical protein